MEGWTNGLSREGFKGQAGTRVEPAPAPFAVRRVDHRLGVILTLGGELDLACIPRYCTERVPTHAVHGRGAVVVRTCLGCGSSTRAVCVCWCERSGKSAPGRATGTVRRTAGGAPRLSAFTGLDRYFAWLTSQEQLYEPRLTDAASGPGGYPRPPPTDRPRPSSTATSED